MAALELDDIQSGVLRPRPTPFAATYVILRIDDRAAGRALMRRLAGVVASAAHSESPARDTWVSASLTFAGLERLGVPQASLDSFSPQFRAGMAARARQLRDVGESAPEHWEKPLGTGDVHVVLTGISPNAEQLEVAVARARAAYENVAGITPIWRQDCYALPDREGTVRFQGRHQPPGDRRQRHSGNQPGRGSAQARRVRAGLHRRVRRRLRVPAARRAGPQRQLRRVPQAAPASRRVPPLPQGERDERRRRGVPRGQDDGALAQRRAAGAVPRSRRPGARRRPGEEQRVSVRGGRSARIQDAARFAHPARESARRGGRRRARAFIG